MAEFRINRTFRALRTKYNCFAWASTNYSTILVPDGVTTNATDDTAYSSETTSTTSAFDIERTWIVPISMGDAVIDGDVFSSVRAHISSPSFGYSMLTGVYVTIQKIDSSGTITNLSESEVPLTISTLMILSSVGTTYTYQLFAWVPVRDKEITSDERIAITTKLTFDDGGGYVVGGMDYAPDEDETYFIIPFV